MNLNPFAPDAVRAARLAVCRACPELRTAGETIDYCGQCGCPIASKTRWNASDCPLGKWPKPEASPVA